jgi:hypothetical protein
MDRYDRDRPSIFPRPFDDDLDPGVPRRPAEPTPQAPNRSIRARPTPEFDAAGRASPPEGWSRQVVVLGSMGLAIVALAGFIGFSLLRSDVDPAVAVAPTSSATASVSEMPSPVPPDATPEEPTASPVPTPEPTPSGPPAEVAAGGWATVTVGELNVRSGSGSDQPSVYRLVRGAVVHVVEGPTAIDGANWYRVASLGGATGWASSGWISEPYLETLVDDPTLIRCGEVMGPVFDVVDGAPSANDPLHIGSLALPAAAFNALSLGAIELMRGMGQEVCFSALLGTDGVPVVRTELSVVACGHAAAEGGLFRLRPAADGQGSLASQVRDPVVLHPSVLVDGQPDDRQSSNLRTIVTMMANDGGSGCIHVNVAPGSGGPAGYRSVEATQCSLVHEYNAHSIKLSPASGGQTAWIKLTSESFQRGQFPLETPTSVSVGASASDEGRSAYAWPGGDCG